MLKIELARRFANMTLRSRLLTYFIVFFILPVVIIGIVSYTLSFNVIKDRAIQFSTQTVDQVVDEFDKLLLEANLAADMIANDPTIQEPLRFPLDRDIAKRYSMDLKIDTRLDFIKSYGREFFGFYVIGQNGGKYKSSYCSVKNDDLRDTDWYKEIVYSVGPVWFSTHEDSFAAETAGSIFISVGLPVKDKASGRVSGAVLVDIQVEKFMDIIKGSKLGKKGYMFVLDNNNNIILSPNDERVNVKIPDTSEIPAGSGELITSSFFDSSGERSILIYKTSALTGWKMVGVVPVNELTKDSYALGIIIAVMILIICILAVIAALYTAGSVAKPIRKLMLLMKRVEEGDLSVAMNVKYDDEIGKLGRSFNVMLEKIGSLMDRVYEEQKNLRKAELKALQAQINPHFLYNTLDSIIWMARANRNEDVVKMVTALTKLFRISISRGRDIISIQEEIDHIKSYLTIQQIRYKSKFDHELIVDEKLFRCKTLKLILQPIVENAIYHGIKEKRGQGLISIIVKEENGAVIFEVTDNGLGMKKEQVKALENTLMDSKGEKMDSYGVKNVDERIKIFFGSDYGLTFYSDYGVGTRVEIKIPKVMEVEDIVKSNLG